MQIENAGDQLINLATLNSIRAYGEVVLDDLRTPGWFIDLIGAATDRRFSEFSRRRFYVSLASLLLKQKFSGERLRHVLVLAPGHLSRRGLREARMAFTWYSKLLVLRLLGCKVVRAGVSIGPFDRVNGWVESFGSRGFDYYGVRDQESLALADRVRLSNARYFPDLAWSYRPVHRHSPAPDGGPVVLSFRSNSYGVVHSPEYLRPIRERLRRLLETPVLARKRVIVAYQVASDRDAALEIVADLQQQGVAIELRGEQLSIDEACALYASACCVISNRLHVLLLAAQGGTLPIALASMRDNSKITSILDDNGLGDLVINVADSESSSRDRIETIVGGRSEILRRIEHVREQNTRRIKDAFANVFSSCQA